MLLFIRCKRFKPSVTVAESIALHIAIKSGVVSLSRNSCYLCNLPKVYLKPLVGVLCTCKPTSFGIEPAVISSIILRPYCRGRYRRIWYPAVFHPQWVPAGWQVRSRKTYGNLTGHEKRVRCSSYVVNVCVARHTWYSDNKVQYRL